MAEKFACTVCRKDITATKNQRYRSHTDGEGNPCEMSSVEIPEHVLAAGDQTGQDPGVPVAGVDYQTCPNCDRKVKLTRLGYFEPHATTLRGGDQCPVGGVRAEHARKTEDVLLPGDTPASPHPKVHAQEEITSSARTSESAGADSSPKALPPGTGAAEPEPPADNPTAAANLYRQPMPLAEDLLSAPDTGSSAPATESNSPESTTTSESSETPEPEASNLGPFSLGTQYSDRFLQPFSPFLQPGEIPPKVSFADSMDVDAKVLAARIKEIFYAYTNRNSSDNRSAQKTLGPSEIGSPCDRQLAMKLLGIKPVNPQEGWAPFVGTAVHAELAKMFDWANGQGSGRFVTEMPLTFGSDLVPRGTADLLDRMLFMLDDHKLMGRWSLDKLIKEGPSDTYRIQAHTYGLGAEQAGEKIKYVAIIAWPRQESSLDKLYVHVEKYDRKIALDAIKRVEAIAAEVNRQYGNAALNDEGPSGAMESAQTFSAGDDCKWCPFYLPKDKGFTSGCPGK